MATVLVVLLSAFSATAAAQMAAPQETAPAVASAADDKALPRAWTITPRVTVGATYTDNALLRDSNKRSDLITEISPGLRISGESARLKAFADYSRRELFYAKESDRKNSQNALNAFGTFKAIDNLFYVDFSAGISQQAISAFGTQSSGVALNNDNETEARSLRVSPYLKGNLGGLANYELRYSATTMRTEAQIASGMDQREWRAHLDGASPYTRILWALDASRQSYDYDRGRKTESRNAKVSLSYLLDTTLKLTVTGGREANNFVSLDTQSHTTHGYGLEWTPTTRTRLALERERRFFGNSHRFSFTHRMPRAALSYADTRSVAATPNNLAGEGVGNIYDLLFNQFASLEPDPAQRHVLVMNFLDANNLAPNSQINSGFLNSGPTVSRQQSLSLALLGARNTLTLTATQGETQRLGLLSSAGEDLSGTSSIRQRGISLNLSHRLSPLSNINLQASRQSSDGASGLATTTRNLSSTFSHKLGPQTTMTLGLRRVLFDNRTVPYSETAFTGTLRMQF